MATAKADKPVILVPLQTIVVFRDSKPHTPPVGTPFEFTADEAAQIQKMNPGAVSDKAVVDAADAVAGKTEEEGL